MSNKKTCIGEIVAYNALFYCYSAILSMISMNKQTIHQKTLDYKVGDSDL